MKKNYKIKKYHVGKQKKFNFSLSKGAIIILLLLLFSVGIYANIKITGLNRKISSQEMAIDSIVAGTDIGVQKEKKYNIFREYQNSETQTFEDPFVKLNPYENQNPLSAYVMFNTSDEVRVYYKVKGKTSDTTFSYTPDEYQTGDVVVPIIGLYANYNNQVDMTLESKGGDVKTKTIYIDTTPVSSIIPEEKLTVDIDVKVQDQYNAVMKNNWLVDNSLTAYDSNGDVRAFRSAATYWDNLSMKIFDGKLYTSSSQINGVYDTASLTSIDLMGVLDENDSFKIDKDEVSGYFHHDITTDGKNYYLLATPEENSDIKYKESLIYVFDKNHNYKYTINFGELATNDDTKVLVNGVANDLHLNSIDYLKSKDELILSSRATSNIYGYDISSGEIDWIIGNKENEVRDDLKDKYLDVVNPDTFNYTSGQHAVFQVTNAKSQPYKDEGKILLSVFDNQSCVDENGNNILTTMSTASYNLDICGQVNSRVLFYAIDLKERTVETVDTFELDTYSMFVSNVLEFEDYFIVTSRTGGASYIYDVDGNLIAKFNHPETIPADGKTPTGVNTNYRADVYTEEEINELI